MLSLIFTLIFILWKSLSFTNMERYRGLNLNFLSHLNNLRVSLSFKGLSELDIQWLYLTTRTCISVCLISLEAENLNMKMKTFFAFFQITLTILQLAILFYYKNGFRDVISIKEIVFLYYCCLFKIFVICIQLWNNLLQTKFCHKLCICFSAALEK